MVALAGNYGGLVEYTDKNRISFEIDGQVYGARDDESGPLGGGVGYKRIYTEKDATVVVRDVDALLAAVENANEGDIIYIPEDVVIDMTDAPKCVLTHIIINKRITLCSNRGYVHEDGSVSTGGVITATALCTPRAIVLIYAEGTRFTGINLRGPDPSRHMSHHYHSFSAGHFDIPSGMAHKYYNNMTITGGIQISADNVEVDNCEIFGFSAGGVGGCAKLDGKPSHGGLIHHCYVHHCQAQGLGYGVSHGEGNTDIYSCMFNFNRHSIQSPGLPDNGYAAHNNIEMGDTYHHYFDTHGGSERGEDGHIAGEFCHIYNNTFLGPKNPYLVCGYTVQDRTFDHNVVFNYRETYGEYLTHNYFEKQTAVERLFIGMNVWGIANDEIKVHEG